MVGVPGRSKACNTCKQRKVSCSQERPECRTCLKASRVCSGYQRERIFLLDPRTQGEGPKSYRKPKPIVISSTEDPISDPWFNSPNENLPRFGLSSAVITKVMTPSTRSVYSQQIFSTFLSISSGSSLVPRKKQKEGIVGSWFTMLPSLPDMTSALETSIMAICTGIIGRLKDDLQMIHEGLRLYAQGLRELQRALWSPRLMYRDETCAACVALILYEIFECPDQSITGWLSHMKGCIKLFELKGPSAFTSEFGHQVFISFRIMEVQLALNEKRRTFLASDDWINLPWKNHPKTQLDKFMDILVSLPNAMAAGTELLAPLFTAPSSDPMGLYVKLTALVDRGWELDARFAAFFTGLEKTHPGPLYTPQLSEEEQLVDEEEELGKVFPVAFHFTNLQTAHLCMMYWASTSILWSGMAVAYAFLTAYGFGAELPPLEHRADRTVPVKNICQSIEYCFRDEHQSTGKTSAIFPLKVAIETLNDSKGCERELAWANEVMKKVGGSARLMKFTGVPWTNHDYLPA